MRQKQQQRQPLAELIDTQWDVNKDNQTVNSMPDAELIDTQWDVNITDVFLKSLREPELIDTQWDVNKDNNYKTGVGSTELIDTQWDVNLFALDYQLFIVCGINRYIVGCKLRSRLFSALPSTSN